jgi:HAD superfamily hydrolase (TIGR01549 family)
MAVLRGVLFDLGSTLIRPTGQDEETLGRMCADLADFLVAEGRAIDREPFTSGFAARLGEFHKQRLHDWVEVTSAYVLRETMAALGEAPLSDEATARALKAFFAYQESRWEPMPGVYEVLEEVAGRGYRLGLISNASDEGNVQRLIDNAGLRRWFEPILVSAAVGVRKPNPRIFEMALGAWGMQEQPERVAMVGDTLGADVLGAQLTGLRSVWLASRADAPANEAHRQTIQPDVTIYELRELPGALAALEEA